MGNLKIRLVGSVNIIRKLVYDCNVGELFIFGKVKFIKKLVVNGVMMK